jgi:methionyl-tRNA formyltransferase
MSPLRLVFMGTPDLGRTVLATLADDSRFQVLAAVAQPDKLRGRGLQLTPPPVKVEAMARGLPVFQPLKTRDPAFLEQLKASAPDVIAVTAYGQILPQALLDIPRHGCLNVHTSLLPRWRGAAPIQWAIADGDAETGVTIMRMEAGLDTGPMISEVRTPISPADTGQSLHDRLAGLGGSLLCNTLPRYVAGELPDRPQPTEGVTYARKITKEDGRLDWNLPAVVLDRRLRAFTPWPGGFAFLPAEPKPMLLKIHRAEPLALPTRAAPGAVVSSDRHGIVVACGESALRLLEIQPEGSRRMTAEQFLAGHRLDRLA